MGVKSSTVHSQYTDKTNRNQRKMKTLKICNTSLTAITAELILTKVDLLQETLKRKTKLFFDNTAARSSNNAQKACLCVCFCYLPIVLAMLCGPGPSW